MESLITILLVTILVSTAGYLFSSATYYDDKNYQRELNEYIYKKYNREFWRDFYDKPRTIFTVWEDIISYVCLKGKYWVKHLLTASKMAAALFAEWKMCHFAASLRIEDFSYKIAVVGIVIISVFITAILVKIAYVQSEELLRVIAICLLLLGKICIKKYLRLITSPVEILDTLQVAIFIDVVALYTIFICWVVVVLDDSYD